ncbi:cupin domain-containing protein [Nocardia panacis]|uniref:cupin domain-containing protein n=1 Tax=Nocardia panacis TaxID=2340916 RepID=UPI001EF04081|nr:cupin domain-containing protein [Nocardia panacis]
MRWDELGHHRPIAEWALGCLVIWHQRAETTGGMLAMAEVVLPRGAELPQHVHAREDELCYVLDGELTVRRGLDRIQVGPGASVWLPRGIPHGLAVRTAQARLLVLITPAGVERAHRAFATAAPELAPPPPGLCHPRAAEVEAEFAHYGVLLGGSSPNRLEG